MDARCDLPESGLMPNAVPAAVTRRFFGCYLLSSKHPRARGRTYIGFTVNPRRRIRQHNGLIVNGAFKTKKWRPWDMVLVVYGFPTQVSALQFEWAWQHPEKSLAVREAAKRLGRKKMQGLQGKVLLMFEMLRLAPWCYYPLTVQVLDSSYSHLQAGCVALPDHMNLVIAPLELLPEVVADDDRDEGGGGEEEEEGGGSGGEEEEVEEGRAVLRLDVPSGAGSGRRRLIGCGDAEAALESGGEASSLSDGGEEEEEGAGAPLKRGSKLQFPCCVCGAAANRWWATCGCGARAHVECLAQEFVKADPSSPACPVRGSCPACGVARSWREVLEGMASAGWDNNGRPRKRRGRAKAKPQDAGGGDGGGAGAGATAAAAAAAPKAKGRRKAASKGKGAATTIAAAAAGAPSPNATAATKPGRRARATGGTTAAAAAAAARKACRTTTAAAGATAAATAAEGVSSGLPSDSAQGQRRWQDSLNSTLQLNSPACEGGGDAFSFSPPAAAGASPPSMLPASPPGWYGDDPWPGEDSYVMCLSPASPLPLPSPPLPPQQLPQPPQGLDVMCLSPASPLPPSPDPPPLQQQQPWPPLGAGSPSGGRDSSGKSGSAARLLLQRATSGNSSEGSDAELPLAERLARRAASAAAGPSALASCAPPAAGPGTLRLNPSPKPWCLLPAADPSRAPPPSSSSSSPNRGRFRNGRSPSPPPPPHQPPLPALRHASGPGSVIDLAGSPWEEQTWRPLPRRSAAAGLGGEDRPAAGVGVKWRPGLDSRGEPSSHPVVVISSSSSSSSSDSELDACGGDSIGGSALAGELALRDACGGDSSSALGGGGTLQLRRSAENELAAAMAAGGITSPPQLNSQPVPAPSAQQQELGAAAQQQQQQPKVKRKRRTAQRAAAAATGAASSVVPGANQEEHEQQQQQQLPAVHDGPGGISQQGQGSPTRGAAAGGPLARLAAVEDVVMMSPSPVPLSKRLQLRRAALAELHGGNNDDDVIVID